MTSWVRVAGLGREYRRCYTTMAAAGNGADLMAAHLAHAVVRPLVNDAGRLTFALDDTPPDAAGIRATAGRPWDEESRAVALEHPRHPGRGPYGDAGYRGNCSGLLIRDLLLYYRPRRVLDPMSGGGTCRDVCRAVGIECVSNDVRSGFDAVDATSFRGLGEFDFVWLHPPYWKMIHWSTDPRGLANAPTLAEFLSRLRAVLRNCAGVLGPKGVLAVLMGDLRDRGSYQALPFRTFAAAEAEGLELAAPESSASATGRRRRPKRSIR